MADVDLAAIRARHAVPQAPFAFEAHTHGTEGCRCLSCETTTGFVITAGVLCDETPKFGETSERSCLVEVLTYEQAKALLADHRAVPALLALVDEQAARIARLHAELDAANARTAERCRQLMAAQRAVEQANAERDHWQRIAAGGDCPTDEFRVEFRRGTWVERVAVVGSEAAAMERVRRAEVEEPDITCAVVRLRTARSVVWPLPVPVPPSVWAVVDEVHVTTDAQLAEVVERANGEKPPESPADPPAPIAPDSVA